MRRLEGKNALITGATSGIGYAIAVRFSQEGANVAINYRQDDEKVEEVLSTVRNICLSVKGFGCKDLMVQGDVSKEDDVVRMFREVITEWGRLDIMINNAGIQKSSISHENDMRDFDKIIAVNLRGAYLCAREAIKHFLSREGGGVILNNSSVHEIIPKPNYLSYAISKGGMGNLTRTLALEYAGRGIRVNAVGPGAIITPINKAWTDDPNRRAEVERHIPMGRSGTPEEIAAVFAFLASDDASYITGQTIYACGGLTLYPDFRKDWSSGG
ncbi:MAG: glucose 1-dehydrogenase [Candidatus Jettenia sp.]|nr:glucose 1-dehydrogenase [Candidatus Jettenia sp.]